MIALLYAARATTCFECDRQAHSSSRARPTLSGARRRSATQSFSFFADPSLRCNRKKKSKRDRDEDGDEVDVVVDEEPLEGKGEILSNSELLSQKCEQP